MQHHTITESPPPWRRDHREYAATNCTTRDRNPSRFSVAAESAALASLSALPIQPHHVGDDVSHEPHCYFLTDDNGIASTADEGVGVEMDDHLLVIDGDDDALLALSAHLNRVVNLRRRAA